MKRILFVTMLIVMTLVVISCAPAAAPAPAPATSTPAAQPTTAQAQPTTAQGAAMGAAYTVAQGDTLASLAEKNLGNKDWLWAIYGLTNAKHNADPSFSQITNPDQVDPGSKIYIPSKEEATAFMAKFDPNNPDITMLRPAATGGQLLNGNWWTSGGELAAINAVNDLYAKQYPGVEVVNIGVAGGGGVNFKGATLTKLQGGDPYDVFQLHAGLEVAQYDPEKYLAPVEDIINAGEGTVMPQSLKDLLTYKGHMWTVPMNIHHGNVLWVNKKIFDDNGLKPPTTWDEFFVVAEALKAKGIVPLAMGGSGGWEMSLPFESVLISVLGPDGYKGLWDGTTKWTDPKVTQALDLYKKILTYTNSDRTALSWDQATALVIQGKAAMNIMGDWADGEFLKANKTSSDYTGIPAPDNKGTFLLISDGFALPLQAKNKDNATNFLKLITGKDAQVAFNIKKGSICSRTDCDYSNFDDYLKSSAAEFQTDAIVPSVFGGAAAVPAWSTAFQNILDKFVADGDTAAAQAALGEAATDAGFPQ